MCLQPQLAHSWDQTESSLSKEASKESVLTSQGLPPTSCSLDPSPLQIPTTLWLLGIPESTSHGRGQAAALSLPVPRTLCPFQAEVDASSESRKKQLCFETSGCPKNQKRFWDQMAPTSAPTGVEGRRFCPQPYSAHCSAQSGRGRGTGCWNSQLGMLALLLTWSCPAICLAASLSLKYTY